MTSSKRPNATLISADENRKTIPCKHFNINYPPLVNYLILDEDVGNFLRAGLHTITLHNRLKLLLGLFKRMLSYDSYRHFVKCNAQGCFCKFINMR